MRARHDIGSGLPGDDLRRGVAASAEEAVDRGEDEERQDRRRDEAADHDRGKRPLDLGPITTLTNFGRLPYARMVLVWTGFALVLIALFWLSHGGFEEVQIRFQLLIDWFKQNG